MNKILYDIEIMTAADQADAIVLFDLAYQNSDAPGSEGEWFRRDLEMSFDERARHPISFFKIVHADSLVSFAGIQRSASAYGAWDLRWGTTHPDFQGRGMMSALLAHRLVFAQQENGDDVAGIVRIAARHPGLYFKAGFQSLYARGPENFMACLYKVINTDADYLSVWQGDI